MFSLVVVLISILLVGLLVVATIYFGGSSFTDGGEKAKTAQLMNEGAQISGAAAMYRVREGAYAPDINTLVAGAYLSAPPVTQWAVYQDTAVATGIPQSQCEELNAKAGVSGIPLCTDASVEGRSLCCQQP